ncbi:FAD-dependent oxidoreductase [Verrucomicrobiaceae bacterium N1E253]|uniref:FAD-dependent oxidoreductase n=1 Tax=Oceaniferula marina TaxID=2748318 RepID=A0A851GIV7_9BACT|nr:FAD-dependent oxidoreductase [Oceaniferula marina]NWK57276.1 FAD-dependent oxidoreductase [Oceaniferula marina]
MNTTKVNEKQVVVLGAGVCGLYAALTLLRRGYQVTVIEKESVPGGLAAGHQRAGNHYDLGVHMLHAFDQEIFDDCAAAMGDERIEVPLDARIKWAGSHYHYPLRGRDILRGIPPWTLARCLLGLFFAELRSRIGPRDDQDAEEALISLYGVPLYEFFFEDFTHRYWEIHPRELSAEFIRSKMPRLSAVDVVKNLLQKLRLSRSRPSVEGALRFETLHYSASGAETLPRCLAGEVERLGGTLHLQAEVSELHLRKDMVEAVAWLDADGVRHELACSHCLSTLPLPTLLRAIGAGVPADVSQSVARLRYKPIAIYGLLVKKRRCMEALYTYYRDCVFHRVGEPANAGLRVTPDGHTVLIVETTCEMGDAKWSGEEGFYQQVLEDLAAEELCQPDEVVECHLLRSPYGYPVFTKGFESNLQLVQEYLEQFSNLRSCGRQGGFTYPNMHRAMRMGADSALDLIACPSS